MVSYNSGVIYDIKQESFILKQKTDEELSLLSEKLKKKAHSKTLSDVTAQLFALIREISQRKLGLAHFDTQLEAGLLLNQGKIVEMKTGEGKTLVSTLPVALNALSNRGVHVITVNDYLAKRDWKWMLAVYSTLGLTSELLQAANAIAKKQMAYGADITYAASSEIVFDYLRDSSANFPQELTQRALHFCLIDEADSILIDESRTPLILSELALNKVTNELYLAKAVANSLEKELHFHVDSKRKEIHLTENGYRKAKFIIGKASLYDKKAPFILNLLSALKATHLFKLNKDYIRLKNKILIVDEFTGRIMPDRRWSMGLHEAVEAKENCNAGGNSKTKSSITYQNFFNLYPKLAGMTGTAQTASQEFQDVYALKVVALSTVKEMVRKDCVDVVYSTEIAKWESVLGQCQNCYFDGRPVLVGTSTIEKSDFLSDLFKAAQIPHKVLNAKPENAAQESEVIAQAGRLSAVTIATNMAGRGTDIVLGGNPVFIAKKKLWTLLISTKEVYNRNTPTLKKLVALLRGKWIRKFKHLFFEKEIEKIPYSLDQADKTLAFLYQSFCKKLVQKWKKENEAIKSLGGLLVLGTEHSETRRVDDQLRGRAGRQGDPGSSRFIVSLEDELLQIFGSKQLSGWVKYFDSEKPVESHLVAKSLEKAQSKIEQHNHDLRKNVLEYDAALNKQRKQFFAARREVLENSFDNELFIGWSEMLVDELKANSAVFSQPYCQESKNLKKKQKVYHQLWAKHDLRLARSHFYQKGLFKSSLRATLLLTLDLCWSEHIVQASFLKETIHLRSYGLQNPLVEYNAELLKTFKKMLEKVRLAMLYYFLRSQVS